MKFVFTMAAFILGMLCFDWSGAAKTTSFVRLANVIPIGQSLEQLQSNDEVLKRAMKDQIEEIDATAATLEGQPMDRAAEPLAKYCSQLTDMRALAKLSREHRDKFSAEIESNLATSADELRECVVADIRVSLESRLRQSTTEFRKTLAETDAKLAALDQIIVEGHDLEIAESFLRREAKIRGATESLAAMDSELGTKIAEFRSATRSVMLAWDR